MVFNPHSKIIRNLILAAVGITTTLGFLSMAFTPYLAVRHPFVLLALDSAGHNLLLTRQLPVLGYLVVATARRVGGAALCYFLGRWYGDVAVKWLERRAGDRSRLVQGVERAMRWAAVPLVFVFPDAIVSILAGMMGLTPWVFFSVSLAGSISMTLAIRSLGSALHVPLNALLDFAAAHLLVISLIFVGVAVAAAGAKFIHRLVTARLRTSRANRVGPVRAVSGLANPIVSTQSS